MGFTRLINLLDKLRSSLWFVPAVMAIGAGVLSVTVTWLEASLTLPAGPERFFFTGGPAGARAILSAIAGSMIGLTGVTFSITIVAISLASSQLGPRLLRNFMRDRGNQFVLGTFIATFVFALLGLRGIDERAVVRTPWLTVVVAFGLALFSLGVLVFFIHHIANSMQADTVIANVGRDLDEAIDRLLPEGREAAARPPEPLHALEASFALRASQSGYLQALSVDTLVRIARRRELVLELKRRPGDFVQTQGTLLLAWPAERMDAESAEALEGAFILGSRRTSEQDLEFLVDQLVETASRSLSPGINDPFTAIACIDRLGAAILKLSKRRFPPRCRVDEEGTVRVVLDQTTLEGVFDAAFNQIRQYGKASVAVVIRLLETFEEVANANIGDPQLGRVIALHADKVLRSSELVDHEEHDRSEIRARHDRVHAVLRGAGFS